MAPVDSEEEPNLFGLPERAFRFTIQPFKKWGYEFFIVGSGNCPGTLINEMGPGTVLIPEKKGEIGQEVVSIQRVALKQCTTHWHSTEIPTKVSHSKSETFTQYFLKRILQNGSI